MKTQMQQTLKESFTLEGVGIHTGSKGKIVVHPAEEGTGRIFRSSRKAIPAMLDFVVDTTRCTTLGHEGVTISTVEHLLSALAGLNVDNALIEVEGSEIPILDGSALPFVEAIISAGILEQTQAARTIRIASNFYKALGKTVVSAGKRDSLKITVATIFEDWEAGRAIEIFTGETEHYKSAIAPARTFAFRQEVEALLAAGLAKGGSLDNALIIDPSKSSYSNDDVVFLPGSFSSPLRVPQEWAAHKLLDVIGDLALLNSRLAVDINIERPGHKWNVELAKEMRRIGKSD